MGHHRKFGIDRFLRQTARVRALGTTTGPNNARLDQGIKSWTASQSHPAAMISCVFPWPDPNPI